MNMLGRSLILFGVLLIAVGVIFMFGGRLPWLGRLPGDMIIQKKNFTFYFPIATSIIISVILSLILILVNKR